MKLCPLIKFNILSSTDKCLQRNGLLNLKLLINNMLKTPWLRGCVTWLRGCVTWLSHVAESRGYMAVSNLFASGAKNRFQFNQGVGTYVRLCLASSG
jgi:hypothetical protein